MKKDVDIEDLLHNMEFQMYMSQNEQGFILEKFDDVDIVVSIFH